MKVNVSLFHKYMFLGRLLLVVSLFLQRRISVDAHGYLKTPRSRNYIAWKEGVWSGGDSTKYPKEDCPHCANIGGTAGQCGVIGSKNYVENLNIYGGPMPANPQETYVEGETIFVDVVLTAHHMGHFEFKACPIVDSSSTTGQEQQATADCFDSYPLEFVSDPWYHAPRDDRYPIRAYIAPPDVSRTDDENGVGLIYRFELQLPPKLVGEWILLQWHYFTANSCIYPGYTSYPYPSKWGTFTTGTSLCDDIPSDGRGLPEQFWNCAEITVIPETDTGNSDNSMPTPSSNVSPIDVTDDPTFYPSISPIVTSSSSSSSSSSESMCGNGIIGNGKCSDSSMCCSHLGWCGTGDSYCKPKDDKATTTTSPSTTKDSTTAPSQAPKHEPISPVASEPLTIPFPDYADGDCSNGHKKSRMTVNVGYYQSWAIYRESGCNPVWPEDIEIEKHGYTHLIYSFASINSTYQLEPWDGNYQDEVPLYDALNALKVKYPKLKTLIAVGGWTFNDPGDTETRFSDTARTAERRKAFAASCVEFCRQYNFDGVDLDWEYPGDTNRGGSSDDKENFGYLLQEIRSAFDASTMELELSMATAIAAYRLDAGYDLSKLAKYLDFFNLMTYDIHGTWDVPKVVNSHTDMNYIFKSVQYFLDAGVPSSKLVLGLAAYGRSYNLADESCTMAGCPFSSAGKGGCAGEKGFMPYFTIDEYVQGKNIKSLTFNEETGSMELVLRDNVWISYDTPETLQLKYDFAYQSCFRGIMWWAVDMLTTRQNALVNIDNSPTETAVPTSSAPTSSAPASSAPTLSAPTPSAPALSALSNSDLDWTQWTVSTDSRCGTSELDARGHCRRTCTSNEDCNTVDGHTCWRVHDNYCDSKPDCPLPDNLDVGSYTLTLRCGPTELMARELCGKPCESYDDCDVEVGEYCFAVNPNFCDSSCVQSP